MTKIIFEKLTEDLKLEDYNFDSGYEHLNNFLYNEIKDYLKESYLQAYLLKDEKRKILIGYITLSAAYLHRRTKTIKKIFKKKGYIPALLIGRLGIDKNFRRQNMGTFLLTKAKDIGIEIAKKIGCRVLFIEALATKEAISFYRKLKFKFVDINLAINLIRQLIEGKKIDENIKMYLDLKKA